MAALPAVVTSVSIFPGLLFFMSDLVEGSERRIYAFVFPFAQPFNLWMNDANNVFNSVVL